MTEALHSAIEGWSTLRHFQDSLSTTRESRRSSFSSTAASECSTFSKVSNASSASSAYASTASTANWADAGAARASHATGSLPGKVAWNSSQQSELSDEGYCSGASQGAGDVRLSEAFLESLDLGHPGITCIGGIENRAPALPTCTGPTTLPAINTLRDSTATSCTLPPQQDSLPNPRRTCAPRTWSRPSLVRQTDRRLDFVEHLVDSATQLVATIWPSSATPPSAKNKKPSNCVIPLRVFIRETLRRSRTSYSTLQVTLYYLVLIVNKGRIPKCAPQETVPEGSPARALDCGRRMFLAGLILASKYLQDRNFSARAWSKISGLPIKEINLNEMSFLSAIDWKLHIKVEDFNEWSAKVSECTEAAQRGVQCPWQPIIASLNQACIKCSSASSTTSTSAPATNTSTFSVPNAFDFVDTASPVSISAPTSRRPSWEPRRSSTDSLPLSRTSTPPILEPQPHVAPPAPPQLGRPLTTPQFTPSTVASNLSTPAVGAQSSICTPWTSALAAQRFSSCPLAWRNRNCSVSSQSSSSSVSSGYIGASYRSARPTGLATAQIAPIMPVSTVTGRPVPVDNEKTPSLVSSPQSMSSYDDRSSNGFADESSSESTTSMDDYPTPPMSDGPISPERSQTSRMFLKCTEASVGIAAAPYSIGYLPPPPAGFGIRYPKTYSTSSLLSMIQTSESSSAAATPVIPSSASNTPTPGSYPTATMRGLKRRVAEEQPTGPASGTKYARTFA